MVVRVSKKRGEGTLIGKSSISYKAQEGCKRLNSFMKKKEVKKDSVEEST